MLSVHNSLLASPAQSVHRVGAAWSVTAAPTSSVIPCPPACHHVKLRTTRVSQQYLLPPSAARPSAAPRGRLLRPELVESGIGEAGASIDAPASPSWRPSMWRAPASGGHVRNRCFS